MFCNASIISFMYTLFGYFILLFDCCFLLLCFCKVSLGDLKGAYK